MARGERGVTNSVTGLSTAAIGMSAKADHRGRARLRRWPPRRHRREIGRQIGGPYLAVDVTIFVDVHAGPGAGLHKNSDIGISRHAVVGFAVLTADRPAAVGVSEPALRGSRSGADRKSSGCGFCRLLPRPTRRCWIRWGSAGSYRHRGPLSICRAARTSGGQPGSEKDAIVRCCRKQRFLRVTAMRLSSCTPRVFPGEGYG